ncbi:MAG: hypothetical protein LPK26_03220 [Bacillaceae bacterium]|nr:hypothetical protein [Bacillaceae bacterium]
MKSELHELTIELELQGDIFYELEFDGEVGELTIHKKTDAGEEVVNSSEDFFSPNFMDDLSISSDMSDDELADSIVEALGNNSFIELDVEISFLDGTEVEFKIENEGNEEEDDDDDDEDDEDEDEDDEDEDEDDDDDGDDEDEDDDEDDDDEDDD